MLLSIEHQTEYHYSHPVISSLQHLHLRPGNTPWQSVKWWNIDAPGELTENTDAFGNAMQTMSLTHEHEHMHFRVQGLVQVFSEPIDQAAPEPLDPLVYLQTTDLTRPHDAMIDFADQLGTVGHPEDVVGVMNAVADQIAYEGGRTDAETTAVDAFGRGHGVCQDQAHVFISVCRLLGIPARYVSGYIHVGGNRGDVVQRESASHAWAQAWLPESGWLGFDPSNRQMPTDHYVLLAVGRDYLDAAPARGVRLGGGEEQLKVEVQVATQ